MSLEETYDRTAEDWHRDHKSDSWWQEGADCTKSGGLIYLAVKEAREGKPEGVVEKENDYGYECERFFSHFTMSELEKYLADADGRVVWQSKTPHPNGKTVWLQIIGQK
ncbi:MAG TPA: hypothetical protein VJK73_00470 [Candidatus Paceibacterota bacterium]